MASAVHLRITRPPPPDWVSAAGNASAATTTGDLGGTGAVALGTSWTAAQLASLRPALVAEWRLCEVVAWNVDNVTCVVPPGADPEVRCARCCLPGPSHCAGHTAGGGVAAAGASGGRHHPAC
jgi:hypothetical protein